MESILVLAALIGLGLWVLIIYNKIVSLDQAVKNSWAQISVHLSLRKDLIPNLVASVKGIMDHESETLTRVVAARGPAIAPPGALPNAETLRQEGEISAALARFVALTENYPQITATAAARDLIEQLRTVENQIAFARQGYNDSAETLNTSLKSIPDVWVNKLLLQYPQAVYWQVSDADMKKMEEAPPQVSFKPT